MARPIDALLAIAAILVIVAIGLAWGHDPFTGLTNSIGGSCCSSDGPSSDCKPTATRYQGSQLQAQIDDRWRYFMPDGHFPFWVDVPNDKILPLEKNPLAGPVVCWIPSIGVMCYLRGRDS